MKIKFGIALATLLFSFGSWAVTEDEAVAQLEKMTLQQVYALPQDEVEKLVGAIVLPHCLFGETMDLLQTCVINAYTTSSRFMPLNRGLWKTDPTGSGLSGDNWAFVRVMDLALKNIKPEPATITYRGTNADALKLPKRGQIMRLKGYTSTSPDINIAKGFLSGTKDMLLVIKTVSARDISGMSGAPEKELLLPRSTWVRFDRSEMKSMQVYNGETDQDEMRQVQVVHLVEVPAPQ